MHTLDNFKHEILLSNQRGSANHGWLKSHHSFSFANYFNPQQMGFSDLRVINDDWIAGGGGFPMHPHADMEIFTYVMQGSLAHKDSMENSETINAGDVQIMSAGTGVRHSEFNPSPSNETHLFQIWLYPDTKGLEPKYQQKFFPNEEKQGKLRLIISPTQEDNSLKIHQNAYIYAGKFDFEESAEFSIKKERAYFIQVLSGEVYINDKFFQAGDALKIFDGEGILLMNSGKDSEILLFDLNKH